jgi:hypothetical protein
VPCAWDASRSISPKLVQPSFLECPPLVACMIIKYRDLVSRKVTTHQDRSMSQVLRIFTNDSSSKAPPAGQAVQLGSTVTL